MTPTRSHRRLVLAALVTMLALLALAPPSAGAARVHAASTSPRETSCARPERQPSKPDPESAGSVNATPAPACTSPAARASSTSRSSWMALCRVTC